MKMTGGLSTSPFQSKLSFGYKSGERWGLLNTSKTVNKCDLTRKNRKNLHNMPFVDLYYICKSTFLAESLKHIWNQVSKCAIL